MNDILTQEFLTSIGFKLISLKQNEFKDGDHFYGVAHDIKTNGMTVLEWSTQGHSCTYFGEKLQPNISIGIRKDAGTRTAFNGYIYSREDLIFLLDRTW